nr:lipase family protein [Sulfurimonas sp. SAG-AH-194-L11]
MKNSIKQSLKYLVAISFSALISGCGVDGNTGENSVEDGSAQFVSAIVLDDINASVMLQYVQGGIDENATNAFAYKAVKITYNTIGENDESIIASGLLVIPTATDAYKAYLASLGKSFSVSMLCDNHGTIFTDAEAPSNVEVANDFNPNYSLGLLTTGYAGFAGVFPDYIGYGASNSVSHPYMLKKSSARVAVDMIKASLKYMEDNNVVVNRQLYVSGYSQGGYNAMATAQSIENGAITNLTLKGVAPMAGPHDLEALANIEINASHTMIYPAFLGYLADSYAFYNNDVNLSDLVVETNTTKYHALFDGSNSNVAIHAGLGLTNNGGFVAYTADALFKTSFITDYQNNLNSIMRQKFIENKSYNNWVPKTKVNLVHCLDDEIIPFSMSQNAFNELNATGADITLSPIPTSVISAATATNPFVHGRCAATAYGATVKWFDDIRAGRI